VHTGSWAKALAELNAVIAATSVAADKNKTIRRMMHHLRTFSGNPQCIAATGSNLFN
jgi:acetylornithine/succinyldiaminopimelate/putrescine aminotransferase